MAECKRYTIGISKAPDNPKEKKDWVNTMMEIQIGMWIGDKATCLECNHCYESIEDFRRRNPVQGNTKRKMSFVCSKCLPNYKSKQKVSQQRGSN